MKRTFGCLFLLFIIFKISALDKVPNQLIFKTIQTIRIQQNSTGLASFDIFLQSSGIERINSVSAKADNRYFVATFHQDINWEAIKNMQFDGIEYIQPNYINHFFLEPNDTYWADQLINMQNCFLPSAWDIEAGNGEIIIAVVDSGINFEHPDLQENIFINADEIPDNGIDDDNNGYIDDWRGWDFVDAPELSNIAVGDYLVRDNDPSDDLFHGTHVAGIIAASANNGEGIAGICWNVRLLPIRSGFSTNIAGSGILQDDDAAAGIFYAADMGADIINLSWGDVNYSPIIADACNYAYQKGCLIVAAAGNSSASYQRQLMYPARLANTIAVGAVNSNKELASFSCYGPQLDVVAPGSFILSTYNNDLLYTELSGTSMAAPFVSAAVGLLLSREAGLSFEQIKSRLAISASDLGSPGFDVYYGNGLLDVESLLLINETPTIEITYPADQSGFSSTFPIIGNINAASLSHYTVKYARADTLGILSWHNVDPNQSLYFQSVNNDLIANFVVNSSLADSTYLIKVEVLSGSNSYFSHSFNVHIDQTPPLFMAEFSTYMERYEAESNYYYVNAVFDEAVYLLDIDGIPLYNLPPYASSNHVLKLYNQAGLENDPIDLHAINFCGSDVYIPGAFQFEREYRSIDQHGFNSNLLSQQFYSFAKTYDFDNNGINDFVALIPQNGQYLLKILEPTADGIIEKYNYNLSFWPHDLGYSATGGNVELLVMNVEQPILFATDSSGFPTIPFPINQTAFSANFCDYDGDGINEIVLVKNETIGGITKRVLALLQRYGSGFGLEHIITNPTTSGIWNVFGNRVVCGNLDGDLYPDLVATDLDGDLMIFEKVTSGFELSWSRKLPLGNLNHLIIGDFTGDGQKEIFTGGYYEDFSQPERSFSYFEIIKNIADNQYIPLDYISFSQVYSSNSVAQADLDGDGDDEIILSVPPNIYVLDFVDGKLTPIWHDLSYQNATNVVAASSATSSADPYIISNKLTPGGLQSCLITRNEVFEGPVTPSHFTATPISENSVQLSWLYQYPALFNIYRQKNQTIELIAEQIENTYFTDSGLQAGDSLYYRITAIDFSLLPSESQPTSWKLAIPEYAPLLTDIKMIAENKIKISFDKALANSATMRGNFRLEPDSVIPVSCHLLEQNKALIICFAEDFSAIQYQLFFDLKGITGVPAVGSPALLDYNEDTIQPAIASVFVQNHQQISIRFSESVNPNQAETMGNYTFVPPANDAQNTIAEVLYTLSDSSYVLIDFSQPLKISNQPYFIKINNLHDLAGNLMSNSGNKCHFSLTAKSGLENLSQLIVYPNPLIMSESAFGKISFINLPLDRVGSIRIYDLSGDLVFKDEFGPYTNPAQSYSWDCRNKAGKKVGSGLYYFFFQMGRDSKRGKFVIVN